MTSLFPIRFHTIKKKVGLKLVQVTQYSKIKRNSIHKCTMLIIDCVFCTRAWAW